MIENLLKRAYEHATQAASDIRNTICSVTEQACSDDEIEVKIVSACAENMRVFESLKETLDNLPESKRDTPIFDVLPDELQAKIVVEFSQSWLFHVRIFSPPILKPKTSKHKMTASQFVSLVSADIEQKVVRNIPKDFKPFGSAYVIYVSHYLSERTSRPAYYDNDNLAIKGILDATVPYICVDDAAIFCDNIYIAQEDSAVYVDIFIVQKPKLREWAKLHRELDFSKRILGEI